MLPLLERKGSLLDLDPSEDMVTQDECAQAGPSEPTPEDMVVVGRIEETRTS